MNPDFELEVGLLNQFAPGARPDYRQRFEARLRRARSMAVKPIEILEPSLPIDDELPVTKPDKAPVLSPGEKPHNTALGNGARRHPLAPLQPKPVNPPTTKNPIGVGPVEPSLGALVGSIFQLSRFHRLTRWCLWLLCILLI